MKVAAVRRYGVVPRSTVPRLAILGGAHGSTVAPHACGQTRVVKYKRAETKAAAPPQKRLVMKKYPRESSMVHTT